MECFHFQNNQYFSSPEQSVYCPSGFCIQIIIIITIVIGIIIIIVIIIIIIIIIFTRAVCLLSICMLLYIIVAGVSRTEGFAAA